MHAFHDRLGRFFEENGMPRMAGRVMGHLLTCEPPEQTFDEVVEAVGAARSTVSVATRLLVQLGIAERFGLQGERRDRYRLRDAAWTTLLEQDARVATQMRALAEDGLLLMRARPAAARGRLRAMAQFYRFLEAAYPLLLERWARSQRRH